MAVVFAASCPTPYQTLSCLVLPLHAQPYPVLPYQAGAHHALSSPEADTPLGCVSQLQRLNFKLLDRKTSKPDRSAISHAIELTRGEA